MQKTVLLASALATASSVMYSSDPVMQKTMWNEFKRDYNRQYEANEEPKRFQVFLENLKIIDERNAKETGTAVHGINKFADLSADEFKSRYLTAQKPVSKADRNIVDYVEPVEAATSADWRGVLTTPVKDQGYCGSCWAFSATEQLESDTMRLEGVTYILSTEQTTQCTTGAFGCGGGWTETAYGYIKNHAGLVLDSDYPYTSYYGKTGTCSVDYSGAVATLTGYTTVNGETNMANYVISTGPLSVCLDASSWSSYTGGIMKVCGNSVDHCVQAVGVDTGSNGYWLVRNSWGTSWGEAGYIRLSYGSNTCDITNDPTYVAAKLA